MPNNLFANVLASVVARQTISFAAAGFNETNVKIIFEVGSPLKSWVPGRAINSVQGLVEGRGYYIVPLQTLDMSALLIPPIPLTSTTSPIMTNLSGTTWDGTNRSKTITGNTAITLNPVTEGGILEIVQGGAGNYTVTINGTALPVNGAVGSRTALWFYRYGSNYTLGSDLSAVLAGSGGGNTTPAAPTIIADDTADTIDATHALGDSEILISINNGAFSQFDGNVINVGDVARAAGYYRFKTKAATGRNESPVASSPAFTVAGGGGGSYDTDAAAYFTRMDAVGSAALSTTFKDAYNAFVVAAKGSGYYSKLIALYVHGGHSQLEKAMLNAIGNTFAKTNNGATIDATGLLFNGSTQYVNAVIVPSANMAIVDPNSGHNTGFGFYTKTDLNTLADHNYPMGSYNSEVQAMNITGSLNSGADARVHHYAKVNSGGDFPRPATNTGLWATFSGWEPNHSTTRTSVYVGATQIGSYGAAGTIPTMAFYEGARNVDGAGASNHFAGQLSLTFYSQNLTEAQYGNFRTHLLTFLTAIGAN